MSNQSEATASTADPATSARARAAKEMGRAGWVAWLVVFWLVLLLLPAAGPLDQLDLSWYALLAHDWREGLQAGSDFIFTYGPFGWLLSAPQGFEPDLFLTKVFAMAAVTLGIAAVLTLFVRTLPTLAERLLAVVLLLYLVPSIPEGHFLLTILTGTTLVLQRPEGALWRPLLVCLLLAAFALVKFTFFVLALPCIGVMAVVVWRQVSWQRAAVIAFGYLTALLLFWLLAGQRISGLFGWLRISAEVASGYNETMGYPGEELELGLGLACAALLASTSAWLAFARPRGLVHTGSLLVLLATMFVAWKGTFVRHDSGHARLFFAFATFAPLVLLPVIAGKVRGRRWLRAPGLCVIALGAIGLQQALNQPFSDLVHLPSRLLARVAENANTLLGLSRYAAEQQEARNGFALQVAMPETKSVLGNGTIDAFGHDQAILFGNDLRVHHRPVFQSYTAFTASLQEANAACYESPSAPDLVLFRQQSIDEYFPTVQDSQALLALICGYRPVLVERDYLGLQRRPQPRTRASLPRTPVLDRRVQMGEWVELAGLPGEMRLLSLDLAWSLRGRLRSFLLRPQPMYLEVKLSDQAVWRFRIAPAVAKAPFLLDPLLVRTQDFLSLYGNTSQLLRVTAFRVVPREGKESSYDSTVGVHLSTCDGLKPAPGEMSAADFERMDSHFWPMLHAYPYHITAAGRVETMTVEGQQVLFAHAPSELRFRLAPGQHLVTGAFGLLDSSWQDGGTTTGVTFHVHRETGSDRVEVFQRLVQPRDHPEDRGMQRFSVPVDAAADSVLLLSVDCGPNSDGGYDWSYWTDVRIAPR